MFWKIFQGIIWNKNYYYYYWYFTTNHISGKYLVLRLWVDSCWWIKFQDSLKYNNSRKNWMMKFFGIQRNNEVFYELILPWVCAPRHAQNTQSKKFAHLCYISRKTWDIKFIFYLQINTNVSCRMIVLLCFSVTRIAHRTQNNKFAISLQYLKKKR